MKPLNAADKTLIWLIVLATASWLLLFAIFEFGIYVGRHHVAS